MFARIVKESLVRKMRRKLIAVASVGLGATVVTAMLNVAIGIGDNVNRELRSYGANIEVLPRNRSVAVTAAGIQYAAAAPSSYINEQDLPKLKSIFWANNILAFAPFINAPASVSAASGKSADGVLIGTWLDHSITTENGQRFTTGINKVSPWWKVEGKWPTAGECLVGSR
ncbi:MAG TPA: ABC transporter permease, partial [Blastocatellia bacterium]|nr:ABC transporter permease [Blastocatellia bacterium]